MKTIIFSVLKTPFSIILFGLVASCGGGGGGGSTSPTHTLPTTPTSLIVNSTSTTQITLAWNDNSDNEIGYKVERSIGNNTYVLIATLSSNTTNYSDMAITTNNIYSYRVKAFNNDGESSASNEVNTSTYTSTGIASLINSTFSSLRGDEILPISSSGGSSGITYTANYLGFALCLPSTPYAPPATQVTPPNNLYGCQNTLTTVLSEGVNNTVSITVTVPKVFIDASVTSSLTGTDQVYLEFTDAVFTLTAQLNITTDGRKQIGNIIGPNNFTYSTSEFHSNDSVLNLTSAFLISLITTQIDSKLSEIINNFVASIIPTLPGYIP